MEQRVHVGGSFPCGCTTQQQQLAEAICCWKKGRSDKGCVATIHGTWMSIHTVCDFGLWRGIGADVTVGVLLPSIWAPWPAHATAWLRASLWTLTSPRPDRICRRLKPAGGVYGFDHRFRWNGEEGLRPVGGIYCPLVASIKVILEKFQHYTNFEYLSTN